MERMMRRRNQLKKRMLRWIVIAAIYMGLLAGAVTIFLGSVWFLKNTANGWWVLLVLCLVIGGWLFFRIMGEGQTRTSVRYS